MMIKARRTRTHFVFIPPHDLLQPAALLIAQPPHPYRLSHPPTSPSTTNRIAIAGEEGPAHSGTPQPACTNPVNVLGQRTSDPEPLLFLRGRALEQGGQAADDFTRSLCRRCSTQHRVHGSEGMMRRRLGWWLVVAMLAASCSTSTANEGTPSDQTDVWFMQHMVPHLLQTTAIVDLAGHRITHPKLGRLANTVDQQGQAHLQQLQEWLASRGLAPHDPQQDPNRGKESDLERLSRVHGTRFDLAFLKVMTARHRTGIRMAAAEARDGGVPEVRELARQMLAELQAQVKQMITWGRAWAKDDTSGA
jgi:uncharacterized protein (DUF305 family)